MNVRRLLATGLASLALVAPGTQALADEPTTEPGLVAHLQVSPQADAGERYWMPMHQVTEDSPHWDARTMGDRQVRADRYEHQAHKPTWDERMEEVERELAKPFPWEA